MKEWFCCRVEAVYAVHFETDLILNTEPWLQSFFPSTVVGFVSFSACKSQKAQSSGHRELLIPTDNADPETPRVQFDL